MVFKEGHNPESPRCIINNFQDTIRAPVHVKPEDTRGHDQNSMEEGPRAAPQMIRDPAEDDFRPTITNKHNNSQEDIKRTGGHEEFRREMAILKLK